MRFFTIVWVLLAGVTISAGVVGQKTFTVIYRYQVTSKDPDSSYFKMLKPMGQLGENLYYPGGLASYSRSGDEATCTCVFSIDDTSCALILDLFGHASFVIPGDTVWIDYKRMDKVNGHYRLDSLHPSPWAHTFVYSGKNQRIYGLFDSLAYHFGPISGPFGVGRNFRSAGNNLDTFFNMVTSLYEERMAYLDKYAARYHIAGRILDLAKAEIKSAYIFNLTVPMNNAGDLLLKEYPKAYLDTLDGWSPHKMDLFSTTQEYSRAAYSYIRFYKVQLVSGGSDRIMLFDRTYQVIDQQFDPSPLKEFLLANCLLLNMRASDPSFISFLGKYKSDFPESPNGHFIDSTFADEMSRRNVPLDSAMAVNVVDTMGRGGAFASLLGKKPVLVDCWASWCAPCLAQMPFARQLEKKYGDRITFVYLSYDRNREAWLAKSRELAFRGGSYLLGGEFKSNFSFHFDITSIPRYLIFDKDGKLVTDNAPRPSSGDTLEHLLDRLSAQK